MTITALMFIMILPLMILETDSKRRGKMSKKDAAMKHAPRATSVLMVCSAAQLIRSVRIKLQAADQMGQKAIANIAKMEKLRNHLHRK